MFVWGLAAEQARSWVPEMVGKNTTPNLLQRTHEVQEDQALYRFGNGLVIKRDL